MKVIETIQSTVSDDAEPTDVLWYTGDDLAQAISAMAMAAVRNNTDPGYVRTLDVTLTF